MIIIMMCALNIIISLQKQIKTGVLTSATQWEGVMGMNYTGGSSFPLWYQQLCNTIPYSLKFSRFKIFAVFAGCTRKFYPAKKLVLICMQTIAASTQLIESCWF